MANIEERLIELINVASLEQDGNKKVEYLYQIKELALNNDSDTNTNIGNNDDNNNYRLLNNFFQDILAFQNERAPNVRKFVLAFIEAACKIDSQLCPKAILSLNLLLHDTNNEVVKRSIQAATQFYRALVQWIAKSHHDSSPNVANNEQAAAVAAAAAAVVGVQPIIKLEPGLPADQHHHHHHHHQSTGPTNDSVDNAARGQDKQSLSLEIEKTWLMWLQIQNVICGLLETSNNDGVRTHCVKFIETIVLMQTPSDKYTDAGYELNLIDPKLTPIKLSNETISAGFAGLPKNGIIFNEEHKLQLVEVAKWRFEQLVVFHGTSHISSVNLMATMQSLVVLAKQRYRLFMGRVIQAIECLNNKLPPTLTESQVQSVKKFLKLQLTVMIKHPYSLDRYQLQITQLLQAVGSKQPEIHKVINDFKTKFGCEAPVISNITNQQDLQKRIKLEHGSVKQEHNSQFVSQGSVGSQSQPVGKSKHLDLNKLTQELDEKEKKQIVVESVKRILGEEKCVYIPPAQMEIKKKVLSTLANEFINTDCPKIIQDYIFNDLRNRHEISYAIIRKNYDIAANKAAKRQIDLLENQDLLKNYFECFNSYLSRAMDLKDSTDRDVVLKKLYALRDEYYALSNPPDPELDQEMNQILMEQEQVKQE